MASDKTIFSGTDVQDELDKELENVETIINEDGSSEIMFLDEESDEELDMLNNTDHYENLANFVEKEELDLIAVETIQAYEQDEASRNGHMKDLVYGIDQLGLSDDNSMLPFEGACDAVHPLLIENATKTQAKAAAELLPANGPVKTQILGEKTPEIEKQSNRVRNHLNWQLVHKVTEFYENSEKAFLQATLFGDAFKKNYYDPILGRVRDIIIPVDRLVVNNACETLEAAERITEIQYISEREMLARIFSGLYVDDFELPAPYRLEKTRISDKMDEVLGLNGGDSEGYMILEQHCYLDLLDFEDESGVPLPYIITVEKTSGIVLSIRRNWEEGGNKFEKREWYAKYTFVPAFGFYGLGLVHLLGNFQSTLTAVLRSLVDAGQFANLQAGFKLKNMRILDDGEALGTGEWRDVEFYGNDINKAFYPLNFKEPSATLFQLLQFVEGRGQKFADSTEQVVADAANYGPVGTTMALLDASTKFFSSIHKRFHQAQKKQLQIIAKLNHENLPDDESDITFNVPGEQLRISKKDYDERVDIIPVSDPNISSNAHRMQLASTKLQAALQSPDIHDVREIYRSFYAAMGEENIEKILPPAQEAQPQEPMEDIMLASQGQPIKAFPDQDHQAHISVKSAFISDPAIAQNQMFQMAIPALQANIREHSVLQFGQEIEGAKQSGINEQQAAQEIQEFRKYKAENPMGMDDPKQILAKAEMRKAENDSRKIDLQEQEQQIDAILEIRKQDLDSDKTAQTLDADREKQRFAESAKLIQEAMKPAPSKSNLTSE